MEERYQVFVSSTFQDLQEERQEVMQALLELDCIPAGMELFPAANDDQWTLIRRVIDDCDYYILVVGNRYGSIGPDGISYTEMEYKYALSQKKPIISFLHKNPEAVSSAKSDKLPDERKKLEEFRQFVRQKIVRFWESPQELGSLVSRSLVQLIKNNPAVGWVRADAAAKDLAAPEILRLRTIIDDLNRRLVELQEVAPKSAENLAQGEDTFNLIANVTFQDRSTLERYTGTYVIELTWNDIFNSVGPYLIDEVSERNMKNALNDFTKIFIEDEEDFKKWTKGGTVRLFSIAEDDFQTVKVQLISLGLIQKSKRNRSIKDTTTYWTLTPFGEATLNKLRAVVRS